MFQSGERLRVESAAALLILYQKRLGLAKSTALLQQLLGLWIMASKTLQTALIRQPPTGATHDLTRHHFPR